MILKQPSSSRFPLISVADAPSVYGDEVDIRLWSWVDSERGTGFVVIPSEYFPQSVLDPFYEHARENGSLDDEPEDADRREVRERTLQMEENARVQFLGLLFGPAGQLKADGLLAVDLLEKRLKLACDKAFKRLAHAADEIRRYLDPEDAPFWLLAGEVDPQSLVADALEKFDRLARRRKVLRDVVDHCIMYGEPLEKRDPGDQAGRFGSEAFNQKIRAIEAVLRDARAIESFESKTALYRAAAERIEYEYRGDEVNSFSRNVNDNFRKAGLTVPKNPKEWLQFFSDRKPERAGK